MDVLIMERVLCQFLSLLPEAVAAEDGKNKNELEEDGLQDGVNAHVAGTTIISVSDIETARMFMYA